jgi:hypothetical protein
VILLGLVTLAAVTLSAKSIIRPVPSSAAAAEGALLTDSRRTTPDKASRDFARPDPSPSTELAFGAQVGSPSPSASKTPTRHKPVAGLTQDETDNAVAIVQAATRMKLPQRASVVALVTALQESHLRNLANSSVPQSLKLPHQGVENNFDSIGVFQQRPSQGWGTVTQLMNPSTAASIFFGRLVKVSGWQTMSVGDAAQAVQRSAFPDAYDKHQTQAQQIVDALT